MDLPAALTVIGEVRTGYASTEGTPIQAGLNRAERAVIEIAGPYREGLDGLAGFGYAWLLTWLDRPHDPGPPPLRLVPFLLRREQRKVGVFATRSPRRVNPIGLSLIQILGVSGGEIEFAGVDLLDRTPVLDLKPYVARFDRPPGDGDPAGGWFDQAPMAERVTPAELGPGGLNEG
jgi:tRNA-Thr(GGU) m(6)t(6)A37 methyltransferase TsaA